MSVAASKGVHVLFTLMSGKQIIRFIPGFILVISQPGLLAQSSVQDFEQELQYQNEEIERLKQEIEETRKRLEQQAGRERSTLEKITNLDEEISLMDRLITQLEQEERRTNQQILSLQSDIGKNQQRLESLQDRYARRVVHTYKQGDLSLLEKVLSSTTWRQAVYRAHYLKIISDIDRKMKEDIQDLIQRISTQQQELESVLAQNKALQRERKTQQESLRGKKAGKQKELVKIRQSKSQLAEYIEEKKAGLKQLEEVFQRILEDKTRFEREERLRRQREALQSKAFAELQGRLGWPADGRVITRFGRQWNAKLKTTTESPGIDIKGQPGSPIKSVANGIVTTITYIRGYGTTIIIDHNGGYYTVYSHVNKIQTGVDSEVRSGDVIAYMGESGSVNGAMLHFEIWGNQQKLDPEQWLTKR